MFFYILSHSVANRYFFFPWKNGAGPRGCLFILLVVQFTMFGMMDEKMNSLENYHFRPSFYNLVELTLLARMYLENGVPLAPGASLDKNSFSQTLLMMKATEQRGQLQVVIHGEDVVGFLWEYDGKLISLFVMPSHRGHGLEEQFRTMIRH